MTGQNGTGLDEIPCPVPKEYKCGFKIEWLN